MSYPSYNLKTFAFKNDLYFCRSYFSLCEELLFVQLYMCDSLQGLGLICVFDFHYSNRSFILMLNHLDVISVTMEVPVPVPGLKLS